MRASLLKTLSSLHAMRGEFDRSRQLADESTAIFERLGMRLAAAQASVEFALRELAAGDCLAAEAIARQGLEALESMGEVGFQSHAASLLAQALCLQGLLHEAARFAAASERLADVNDVFSQSEWRMARAQVLAGEGDVEEALTLAQAAVGQIAQTELVFLQGNAYAALADVLRQAGRYAEAVRAAEAAFARYDSKGATAMRDHVGVLLVELADEQHAQV
jgi:tetratricopeptide (TPR) repeat protein